MPGRPRTAWESLELSFIGFPDWLLWFLSVWSRMCSLCVRSLWSLCDPRVQPDCNGRVRLTNSSVLGCSCESRTTSGGFPAQDSTTTYTTLLELHQPPSLPVSWARLSPVPMTATAALFRYLLLCLGLLWKFRKPTDGALLPDISSYAEIVFVMTVDLYFIAVGIWSI